ncbi:MAG: glycosyltransferase [Chitinophagaceae bacterium]|nr:MAG: glycosyltransferase [Chitinophagaceae bacterium]
MSNNTLIIFVKNRIPGKVKTRLAKTIGEEKTLAAYDQLLSHTFNITIGLSCDKVVYYSDFIPESDQWSQAGYRQAQQQGNDLGERMSHTFKNEFKNENKNICLIGSDCPQLNISILENAFDFLGHHNIVIGPATDGGYYLIGMQYLYTQFFINKHWSTQNVFADTIHDVKSASLKYRLLPILSDLDEEKDLYLLKN